MGFRNCPLTSTRATSKPLIDVTRIVRIRPVSVAYYRVDFATTFLWVWVTATVLAAMDYTLTLAHLTSDVEITMLSDLIVFDGVLIGSMSVLAAQDLRDLVRDAEDVRFWPPGLRETHFHNRRLQKRRSDITILLFLLTDAFGSLLAIPWVEAAPSVGFFALPLQVTILGIGLLLSRMVYYL